MQFTGHNLNLIRFAVELAVSEIRNEIATCPDVNLYEYDLEDLEEQKDEFERLLARIDKAIEKESKA